MGPLPKSMIQQKPLQRFNTEEANHARKIPVYPFSPAGVEYVPSWGMSQNMEAVGFLQAVKSGGKLRWQVIFFPQGKGGG